ncbi:XdhC family protein [Nocardia sp. X0981]
MLDQFEVIAELLHKREPFAVARVVSTFGSAPRLPGASMVVTSAGTAFGSVSGGCVEGAVYESAVDSLATGTPSRQRFGVSDEAAFGIGLTCGGIIDIFIQPFVEVDHFPHWRRLETTLRNDRAVALATIVEHPDFDVVGQHILLEETKTSGTFSDRKLLAAVAHDGRGILSTGTNRVLTYGVGGRRTGSDIAVFVESSVPRPRMIIVGAIDFAAAVAEVGSFLGYHVTVCDARGVFATAARFPSADAVVVGWPSGYVSTEVEHDRIDPRTVVCVLTHDPKFDIPVLRYLLTLPDEVRPRYIGAMGSRTTHEDRVGALRSAGVTPSQLALLRSPVGLDLGARTPEETAISIGAEIIADRWGGTGERLSSGTSSIHR